MATGQAVHGAAGKVANFGIIAAFAAFAAFPFAWMLITTFKRTGDLLDPGHNPFLYTQPPTLDNLRILFNDTLFVRWAANTMFIGVLVVLITLLIAVTAGYSLARQEFVYALTFISSAKNFTVSVGVPSFLVRGDVYFWGSLMAACFIASVPIAFLYNLFVDRFIAGFTAGAVKG